MFWLAILQIFSTIEVNFFSYYSAHVIYCQLEINQRANTLIKFPIIDQYSCIPLTRFMVITCINPLSTRPLDHIKMWSDTIILDYRFSKNSELCTKRKRKLFCQKLALICHSYMLRWLIGIILGKIISKNPQIGNIYKDWRSLFWVQIGNFLDWKGMPNVHILFCPDT